MPSRIDEIVERARTRLRRLEPQQAAAALAGGSLLVDIRPLEQRDREGLIPGALVVDRNVLEWRLDPTSPFRIPGISDHDQEIVVFCSEEYASSLAAVSLQELGFARATDLAGFRGWIGAGLPVRGPSATRTTAA